MNACIGEPVSYLRLERYGLGELPSQERRRIAEHLAACALCRTCFERVQADTRDLTWLASALPNQRSLARAPQPHASRAPTPSTPRAKRAPWAVWGGALGASLLLGLALLNWRPGSPSARPAPSGVKGDALALEVVRLDARGRLRDPDSFGPGDRFKLLLTCPPSLAGSIRVLAFQAGEVFEPVPAQPLASCGNRRALAGAWQFDGEAPVALCVVFSDRVPADRIGQARSPESLPEPRVCVRLLRAPEAVDRP